MPFTLPLALALYATIWWIVLFAVLPLGVRSADEAGEERREDVARMIARAAAARNRQLHRTQHRLHAEEPHPRRDPEQVGDALVGPLLVLDGGPEPHVFPWPTGSPRLREQPGDVLRPLRQQQPVQVRRGLHQRPQLAAPLRRRRRHRCARRFLPMRLPKRPLSQRSSS